MITFYVENDFYLDYVAKDVANKRMETCRGCDKFLGKTARCGVCECFMPFKTKLLHDPVASGSVNDKKKTVCPLGHWD